MAVATHGGAAATSSLSPQTFLSTLVAKFDGTTWKLKAVKWNSPFYGIEGQGWFLSYHCFTKYVKVTFFRGASLHPLPPGASKHKDVRYLDIYEDDKPDEKQIAAWVKQASELPGWLA